MNREDRIERMADLVLQRALRKAQNRNTKPPPAGVLELSELGDTEMDRLRRAAVLAMERSAYLRELETTPGGRIGNVTLFPPSRRVRSTTDVALLEIGIA